MGKYEDQSQSANKADLKGFFKSTKGLICTAVAGVILLGGLVAALWMFSRPKFQDVTVELGTESVSVTKFMTRYANLNKVGFVSDPATIDLNKVGETEVTLRHGSHVETVLFKVADTTPPQVTFLEELTMREPGIPDPAELVKSISDQSETTVSYEGDVVVPAGYDDLTCTVVVTDASGNATTGKCRLSFGHLRSNVALEYGKHLTKADILLAPERDEALIEQRQLDQINQSGPGKYTISVHVGEVEETCTVTVQDTTGPQLVVRDVSIEPEEEFSVQDFVVSVSDNSGGIRLVLKTPLDNRKEETQKAVIEAQDPYGNITTAEAVFRVTKDDDGPKINFAHDYVQAQCGGTAPNYMEGVTAFDEVDGECMVIYDDSAVKLDEIGTYEVVYTAKDKSGNTTKKSREVVVTFDYSAENLTYEAKMYIQSTAAGLSDDPEEIRDYVRDNIKYNSNWGGEDPISYGFEKRKGNCYVHALILKALLDEKGYETELIWVKDHTHYWVVIKLDGVWRHIDATPSRGFHNKYSLMDDEQRLETLKGREWDRDLWPACE